MAAPFANRSSLRQRILLAIGGTSLLSASAFGCASKHPPPSANADAGMGAASGAGAAVCGVGKPMQQACLTRAVMNNIAEFGCGMGQLEPSRTPGEVAALFKTDGCLERFATCDGCCNPSMTDGVPRGDGSCCYTFCSGACCGRPLLIDAQPRLAGVMQRSDWLRRLASSAPASTNAARIADEWLEDARMEHASIASFARFTLDLLSYGAPADLVELAQKAALDEVEHARLCFGLAERYGQQSRGPSQLSAADLQLAPSLWHAAIAAFHEGCIGETLAALQALAALEVAEDPAVRIALARIADDEARHAELSWKFVSWAMSRLGPQLGQEIRRGLTTLISNLPAASAETDAAEVVAALHAAGRLTAADKQRSIRAGLREVVAPCVAALAGSGEQAVEPRALA